MVYGPLILEDVVHGSLEGRRRRQGLAVSDMWEWVS